MQLTDQSLLAQLLCTVEVLLPLEQSEGLVDQGQNVHASDALTLLLLDGSLELLDGLLVFLLIEQ